MKSSHRGSLLLLLVFIVFMATVVVHFPQNFSTLQTTVESTPSSSLHPLYNMWLNCIKPKMDAFKGNASKFWLEMPRIAKECDALAEMLNINRFTNKGESKYHILPNTKGISTVLSLGVGHDTRSEEKLRKALGNESVEFFGADPMVEVNDKLYSAFGQFYPFAIGAESGVSTASVLDITGTTYSNQLVVHLDIIYFLSQYVRRQFIDNIWLDAEGAEYELFPFFYRNGKFDENGFTFCQVNMEIHRPTPEQTQLTHDFLFRILEDQTYAIIYLHELLGARYMRIYLVNFEDPMCRDKYLPQ